MLTLASTSLDVEGRRGVCGRRTGCATDLASFVEQLPPTFGLAVVGVLDLDPSGSARRLGLVARYDNHVSAASDLNVA